MRLCLHHEIEGKILKEKIIEIDNYCLKFSLNLFFVFYFIFCIKI